MFRIDLFRAGEYLLLTPRWGEWQPWLQITVMLLLCLIPLSLIIYLYRTELKIITKGAASLLLSLRLVVVTLVLFLVCLQPTYGMDREKEIPGRVILAVDVSESMNVVDPQRPDEEKLQLALALGFHKGKVSDEQIKDWIDAHRKKRSIDWVSENEHKDDAKKRRLLEKERQEIHDQLIEKVNSLSRKEIAKQILSEQHLNLVKQIKDVHQLDVYAFALDMRSINTEVNWEEQLFGNAKKADNKEEIDGRFASTDLTLPLKQATNRSGVDSGRILGVVLLTDGQHNLPVSLMDRTTEMAERKIPIYPIAVGARQSPPDIAILGVSMPPTVFQDVDVNVAVRFRVTDIKEQDLKITIFESGKENEPLEERTVKHDGKNQEFYETFSIRMKDAGTRMLNVRVEPQSEDVKETDQSNNTNTSLVNVAKDKADVLVIDGEARWELHYLFNALLRDRAMKVKGVVFHQPRLGKVPQSDLEKMDYPDLMLPKVEDSERDPLFKYDCIILGDIAPEQLPPADRKRLEKYVADRGGTLVVLAGKRYMPMTFLPQDLEKKVDEENLDPLIRMLPIERPREVKPNTGFRFTLTQEGTTIPYLQLEPGASTQHNQERWAKMRKHYWGVIGHAKPGATTLAYVDHKDAEEKERPEDDPVVKSEMLQKELEKHEAEIQAIREQLKDQRLEELLTKEKETNQRIVALQKQIADLKQSPLDKQRHKERSRTLVAAHNYGFGQVLYVGVDSTWRWRYRAGDTYHHRFWGQTIRWAASDKPLVTGNKYVRFGTAKPIYRHDEKIDVLVRMEDILGKLPPGMEARARIYRKKSDGEEEQVAFVKLDPKTFQPRALEGQIPQLLPGEHYIELDIPALKDQLKPDDPNQEKLRSKFTVASRDDGEMVELSTNYSLLKQLATKTGNPTVYTPETAHELVKVLEAKTITKPDPQKNHLWQWWPTLVLLLSLLTIEWVARKWVGLP